MDCISNSPFWFRLLIEVTAGVIWFHLFPPLILASTGLFALDVSEIVLLFWSRGERTLTNTNGEDLYFIQSNSLRASQMNGIPLLWELFISGVNRTHLYPEEYLTLVKKHLKEQIEEETDCDTDQEDQALPV